MRVAVISDIHGNLPALEAVEADIATVGVDLVVNLGDLVAGPIDPAGVVAALMARGYPTIRGNHDRHLHDRPVEALDPVDTYALHRLSAAQRDWLAGLPATLELGGMFLCHGTPTSDTAPWLDGWWTDRNTTFPDEAAVATLAEGLDFGLLLCGHTHLPRIVRLGDGRLIVNPGAVGLQFNHGAPDARYAVVEEAGGRWSASLRAVPYDHQRAAALATANGFPRWAEALVSGWKGPAGLF